MRQETKQINCKKVQQYDILRSFFYWSGHANYRSDFNARTHR